MNNKVIHPFDPIYNKESKILILGSVASEKSRQLGYPYANPQNRFWKIMKELFNEEIIDYKKFLLKNNIALWDVIESCTITGSSDSSIKDVTPNDINSIIKNSNITKIFITGKTAYNLYNKYILKDTNIEAIYLSSPSPANATKSLNDLVNEYKIILK